MSRQPRFPVDNAVFIEVVAPEFGSSDPALIVKCRTIDVSRGGLRVSLDHVLPVGAILQFAVELPSGAGTLYLVGEVKWSLPMPLTSASGSWCAGLAVMNAGDSDVDAWVSLLTTMEG